MTRYVAVPLLACLLLGAAFWARGRIGAPDAAGAALPEAVLAAEPELTVTDGPDGRVVRVSCLCAGGVSRASLVYELDGARTVADRTEDCAKALSLPPGATGPVTEVVLAGPVPAGARDLRVVVEGETGNRRVPLALP